MNILSVLMPVIIYLIPLLFGLFYIAKKSDEYAISKTPWYILLVFMPIIALLVFYFTQVKPKAN